MPSERYNHNSFVLSPLVDLVKQIVASASAVGDGIELSAINDYVLHSMFLQLTGAQEQKFKCIVWELASDDLQYRYDRYNKWELGECSKIDDKSEVYSDIIGKVRSYNPTFKIFANSGRKKIFLNNILSKVDDIISRSNFVNTHHAQYQDFKEVWANLAGANIDGGEQLIIKAKAKKRNEDLSNNEQLFGIYRLLYLHRNRCAHNVMSYQDNLPPFWELRDKYFQSHYNVFIFIALLVMIDEMVMTAYKELLRLRRFVL